MINTSPLLNYIKSHNDIKAINQWRSDVKISFRNVLKMDSLSVTSFRPVPT